VSFPPLKRLLRGAALAAWIACAGTGAMAQAAFPTKPIRIIIPFAPGGSIDVSARWIAERLAPALGQPVIIDNKPGGDGMIAMRAVKDAPADGHTLMAVSSLYSQALALKKDPGYEARDFVAVAAMSEAPLVVSGPSSNPEKTLAQILAKAKADPESVSFGSGGVGTAAWLSATMMAHMAGVKLLHIPYKGVAAARPDLLGGRLTILFDTPAGPLQHVQEGRLRVWGELHHALGGLPEHADHRRTGTARLQLHGLQRAAGARRNAQACRREAGTGHSHHRRQQRL